MKKTSQVYYSRETIIMLLNGFYGFLKFYVGKKKNAN